MAAASIGRPQSVGIVGGGFSGLTAGYVLTSLGIPCTVYEKDDSLGGLAGCFGVGGAPLEKFYHHIFANDRALLELIEELGLSDRLLWCETNTGVYYAGRIYRLSTPLDVLRFTPLALPDRLRLGLLALRARWVSDHRRLESITARDWLIRMAGRRVYEVVWEPLLRGKFGRYADQVAAPWFWSKLKLRGGSRSKKQAESLAYVRGGFEAVAKALAERIQSAGGTVLLNAPVERIIAANGRVSGVVALGRQHDHDVVLATVAPQVLLELAPDLPEEYRARLAQIEYLGVMCLVLALNRRLSSTYWLNINDPQFPFVGIIEHTNLIDPATYGGRRLVYITKYLTTDDRLYRLAPEQLLDEYLPWIQRIFPEFDRGWVTEMYHWREPYAQPIITCDYSRIMPPVETPVRGLFVCNMAQVYPEDRGANYAVIHARRAAKKIGVQDVESEAKPSEPS